MVRLASPKRSRFLHERLRLNSKLPSRIKLFLPVQSRAKKYSASGFSQITFLTTPSTPLEGRIAIVTDAGLDAMDADGATDESTGCGRRSRVVLTPRRWRQVGGINSAGDGGKRARSPGRARRKPLKPLRGECRAFSGVTVVTNARVTYTPRAAAGASGARHSLRPLYREGRTVCKTRVLRAAGMRSCV